MYFSESLRNIHEIKVLSKLKTFYEKQQKFLFSDCHFDNKSLILVDLGIVINTRMRKDYDTI